VGGLARLALALVLAPAMPLALAQSSTPTSAPAQGSHAPRLVPLEVVVNGAKTGTWLLLEKDGALYAPQDAFEEWRVQRPMSADTLQFRGATFWPLSEVPGFRAKIDYSQQLVELAFSPQAFAALRISPTLSQRPQPGKVLPSVFFNYEANVSDTHARGASDLKDVGVLNEVGISNQWGVLTSSGLAQNLADDKQLQPRKFIRLETTFTKDFPDQNRTLRIGDTTTRSAMWGRDVYFGGFRYGTNFALTPGFVSQPLPALTGLSAAPSTVELYVNDVLRQVSNVPTGPFAIDNLPVLTGNGEARLVVKDLLGRETVIVQSFFTSSQLLAPGLDDWSVEGGRVREDLGVVSDHYGDAFAATTWRHGFTNNVTLESRAEATPHFGLVGGGIVSALPFGPMVGKFSLVASTNHGRSGGLWFAGLDYAGNRLSASLQAQGGSREFRQLGQDPTIEPSIRLQLAGNLSYYTDSLGTFGLGFATIRHYDAERVTTLSANYAMRVGKSGTLSAVASRAFDGTTGNSFGLNFIMPLDQYHVASTTYNARQGGQSDAYATVSGTPTPDSHVGWRVLAGQLQNHGHAEGGLYYFGDHGDRTIDAVTTAQQSTVRLGANGGFVFTDGKLFSSRKIDESFAVAEVPGYSDIGIGLGSNVLAHTDKDGVALVPRLLPYNNNAVRIDPKELPVSAEIDTIEINAVPSYRSGVLVKFPVRGGRGALLKILFDDGGIAPAGAVVRIAGDKEDFYVARRGEAYVTGLTDTSHLTLSYNGGQCAFDVKLPPPDKDVIPRLGPFDCHGVKR
jgi:outer membrane usher protein